MKRSQIIAGEMKSKRAAMEAIFARHRDEQGNLKAIPEEDRKQIETIQGELKTLSADFASATDLEKIETENAEHLKTLSAPQYTVPLAGNQLEEKAAGRAAGQAELEGFAPAGATVVQTVHERKQMQLRQLSVAYEEGELGLDQKTLAAISSRDYKTAFRNYLRKGQTGLTSAELKTLQEGSDTAGGFLVPEDMLNMIIEKRPTPTRVAGLVTRLQTSRDALTMPKVNYSADDKYTTGIRTTWTGEIPASSTAHRVTDPVFGQIRIPIHTAMMSMPITNDMVEDAAFPIVGWASGKFNETIDLLYDDMIINGSGIGQPAGVLLNPGGADQPAVIVTGSAATVTGDGLWDLVYSLPEQYDENARMVLNKTSTARAIAKLKDSQNRYLFGYGEQDNGLAGARPKELCGYPYVFSGFMPDLGANAFPISFGDHRGYFLVNRVGFSIQVLRELYAETNQILLLGRVRFGGQVAEPFKLKIQKCSV